MCIRDRGHILGFYIAVVATLVLHPQDVHRLVPDGVQVVALPANTEHFIGGAASAAAVQSDLNADGGVIACLLYTSWASSIAGIFSETASVPSSASRT